MGNHGQCKNCALPLISNGASEGHRQRFIMPDHKRLIEIENWDEVSKYVPDVEKLSTGEK
tara:strand:- start:262 stop:441 length:180 start_codon:yes stop_codon:yes gene_type:complete